MIRISGDNRNMDVKWLDGGHLAEIDCSFETDTVAKKISRGYVKAQRDDYNDDFNNDYNNK